MDKRRKMNKVRLLNVVKVIHEEQGCNWSCAVCVQEGNYPKKCCRRIAEILL